jgi:Fe-S cluster biosynthesis and repair protein YggX
MATIICSRCHQSKPSLDEAPVGGPLGETLLAHICTDCWDEWRTASSQMINHYGLNLGLPEHRQQLRQVMKEFLGLEA